MQISPIAPASSDDSGAPRPRSPISSIKMGIAWLANHKIVIAVAALVCLIGVGVFAKNGWFPSTDSLSGKRTGWFGKEIARNAPSSWNPFVLPSASPTPQLSKEYIYAGSRLLAVEDANAAAVPPADLAVWRPSTGVWWVLGGQGSQQTVFQYGQNNDKPVPGDFDGDGKTDFAVVRPTTGNLTWFIMNSSNGAFSQLNFGLTGSDEATVADYDGDGKTDIAVFRPSDGTWYIRQSSNTATAQYSNLGQTGDQVAPADYDGDGKADPGVWRSGTQGTFYIRRSSDGQTQSLYLGSSGGKPVSGDYDGDGKADFAVLNGNAWTILSSITNTATTTPWQAAGGIPVQNDYDGDGKCDIAIWLIDNRNCGQWYIKQSHDGSTRAVQYGLNGDIPVPAFYRR